MSFKVPFNPNPSEILWVSNAGAPRAQAEFWVRSWALTHSGSRQSPGALPCSACTASPGSACSASASGWVWAGRCWGAGSKPSAAQTPYKPSPASWGVWLLSPVPSGPRRASAGNRWTPVGLDEKFLGSKEKSFTTKGSGRQLPVKVKIGVCMALEYQILVETAVPHSCTPIQVLIK